jgi:hypothetical protein
MSDVAVNFSGKLHGWNLTTKPGHDLEAEFWITWDWQGWVRKQIDYAMAIGANSIRVLGDIAMVTGHSPFGTISQALYNQRWAQIAAYCAQNNLGLYYCGCATYGTESTENGTNASYTASHANFCAVIQSNIDYLCGGGGVDYSSIIIGVDLVQEASVNFVSQPTSLGVVYNGVTTPSGIGKTFSCGEMISNQTWMLASIAYLDYLDFHMYADFGYGINGSPTPTDITNGPRTTWPNKEILFGEGGASEQYTSNQIRDWFIARNALQNMADAKVRGGLAWSVQDQSTTTARKFGAFDSSWAPHTSRVIATIKGLANGATLTAPTNLRVRNGALLWDLNGCSTDFASTRLYRDGTQIADQTYAHYAGFRTDDATHSYTATVVNGSGTESAPSAALVVSPLWVQGGAKWS